MKICISERQRLTGGSGIMDHVMTVVQIIGMTVTVVALKHFTTLPFVACCLIGIPLFLVIFLGSCYLLSRLRRKF